MPTDDETKTGEGHNRSGNVTQPFVTEPYKCVARYETKDTKNKPFKVAVNEKVDVIIKDKGGEQINLNQCHVIRSFIVQMQWI